jgi:hypothetical protein
MSKTASRTPDKIIIVQKDNTKFTIHQFFDGKEELPDIIARRVIKDLDPVIPKDDDA